MFKWLKNLFSKKHETEEPAPEEMPVVETPAETVTLTFVPAPAEEQQEMPESRYDTPEYQEFLKEQETSDGSGTPEEESPEVEVTRTEEAAQEDECPETDKNEETPEADRSKLQY